MNLFPAIVRHALLAIAVLIQVGAGTAAQAATVSLTETATSGNNSDAYSSLFSLIVAPSGTSYTVYGGSTPVSLGTSSSFDAVYSFTLPFSATTSVTFQLTSTGPLSITPSSITLSNASGSTTYSLSSASGTSDITLVTATLLEAGSYLLHFTVDKTADFSASQLITGSVSAVPLPGAAALFASALIGFGILGRKARKLPSLKVASASAACALVLVLGLGVSAPAKAASFNSVLDLGSSSLPDSTSALFFWGNVGPTSSFMYGGAVSDPYIAWSAGATTKSASGNTSSYALQFTLAQASNLVVTLTDTIAGTLNNALSYDSIQLSGLTPTTTSSSGNSLVVTFSGLLADTVYSLVVTAANNTLVRNLQVMTSVSAVPIPGAIVLFGSALIALAGYGRFVRARSAA